jgi:DNA polymerase-3 subunit beta
MKITIPSDVLNSVLKSPVKASQANKTLQILNHIYLSAKDDGATTIVGANPEYSVSVKVETNVEKSGEVLVLGDKFLQIVGALPKSDVIIEFNDGLLDVYTSDGNIKFSLQTLSVDEYPKQIIEGVTVSPFCVLPQVDLKKGLRKISKFCSNDDSINPVFSGILFDWNTDGSLKLVATDTKRMGIFKIGYSGNGVSERFVVPNGAASIVEDALKEGPVSIGILKDEDGNIKNVMFNMDGIKVTSSVIAGNFPDYEKIIPKDILNMASISTKSLKDALRRISLIVDKETNRVSFEFDEVNLKLNVVNSLLGSGSEIIPCKFSGTPNSIHFNYEFIGDYLDVVDGEVFNWGFNEVEGANKFWSSEDENFLYIAMPLRRS